MSIIGYLFLATLLAIAAGTPSRASTAEPPRGHVVDFTFESSILREARIGISPQRHGKVYLPPSYSTTNRRYPVVVYCHSLNWSPRQMFADGQVQRLIERGLAAEVIPEFILVVPDFTSPTMGSLYENSPVSGRWLDHVVEEVVPRVDQLYRTLARRESRSVVGDFMGGRGALALAMRHADIFGSVYAMHPVATGSGDTPWARLAIDWRAVHTVERYDALPASGRERIFVMISQAFLPELERPPFFCDFPVEWIDGAGRPDFGNIRRAQLAFHLDAWLDDHADNLRSLRGLAMDWGRFDPTPAHVDSNRAFSRLLVDLGVPHEAEEFNGDPWDRYWDDHGRFAHRVLPFLGRSLVGEIDAAGASSAEE